MVTTSYIDRVARPVRPVGGGSGNVPGVGREEAGYKHYVPTSPRSDVGMLGGNATVLGQNSMV